MNFETLFPGFVSACVKLHGLLMPCAMALLVLSFVFFFWQTPPHPIETLKFITKLFLIVMLIINTRGLLDVGQQMVRSFVEKNIDARPERVAQRYREKLAEALQAPDIEGKSFLDMLLSANVFEALIFGVLTLVAWFAAALLFFVYLVQKALLLLSYSTSSLLFAMWAIPILSSFAYRHLFRLIGLLLWPIGLALAATITDGLIDAQTNQQILLAGPVTGTIGYGLQNLLGVAVTALWVISSTILAPLFIQRFVTGQSGAAVVLPRAAHSFLATGLPLLQSVLFRSTSSSSKPSRDSNPMMTVSIPGEVKTPPFASDSVHDEDEVEHG